MSSSTLCIAILAPGQMGSSFSALFKHHSPSIRLITNLTGRSRRTAALAQDAGIEDLGSHEGVLESADIIFSILVPRQAFSLAESIVKSAEHLPASSIRTRFYVDLNAVAPSTSLEISKLFASTPIAFVDGGVIGGPATATTSPLIALSGPLAGDLDRILSPLFAGRTKVVGNTNEGQASALKLSYASLNKGMVALATTAGVLAAQHGVSDALEELLAESQPGYLKTLQNGVPRNMAKAFRWVAEMHEISVAFADVGLDGGAQTFLGIAQTYELVAGNEEVGKESIEEALAKGRSHTEVIEALSKDLKRPSRGDQR